MTGTLVLTLPWPPSLNAYYRHVGPKVLISACGRAYRESVALTLLPLRLVPLAGRVWMEVDVYPPTRGRHDLDNLQKVVWDSLNGRVYNDDSQVDDFRVIRRDVVKGGKIVVRVRELGD